MLPRLGLFHAVELRTLNGGSLQQYVSVNFLEEQTAEVLKLIAAAASPSFVVLHIQRLQLLASLGSVAAQQYFEDGFLEKFVQRNHHDLTFDQVSDVWRAFNEIGLRSLNVKCLQTVFDNNSGLLDRVKLSPQDHVACDVKLGFAALHRLAHHPEDKSAAAAAAIKYARLYAAEFEPVASSLQSVTKAYQLELLRDAFSPNRKENADAAARNWNTYCELGVFSAARDIMCKDARYLALPIEQQQDALLKVKQDCLERVAEEADYYCCLAINNMLDAGADAFVANQVAYIDFIRSAWIDDATRKEKLNLLCQQFEGHAVTETLRAMLQEGQEPERKRLCL